jgi:peptide/nickel transport system ATP-binding protein
VTHDLATAKFFCDTIAIMYLGRVVEYGPAEQIYADPRHPYTQALLRAIPEPDPSRSVPRNLPRGEVPDAAEPPRGCSFHPRCPAAFELCGWEPRDLTDLVERHWVSHPDEPVTTDITAPLLDAIKAEDPREPLWSGVREIRPEGDGVVVEFREDYIDPPLYDVGAAKVACLLYRDSPGEPPV